jgi:type 1 glutamine amidotransferase
MGVEPKRSAPAFALAATFGMAFAASAPAPSAAAAQTLPVERAFRPAPRRADALPVLLVTGGHDHDVSFYSVLDGHDDLAVTVNPHPDAFRGKLDRYRVVVLYDMVADLEPERRANLQAFVEGGGGIVGLHHTIAGYGKWPWWSEEVAGARYRQQPEDDHPASSYLHDLDLLVRARRDHPITRGLAPFRIHDETYKGLWLSPRMEVLLETDDPTSDGPLAWTMPHPRARIAYVQLGHGREAHMNPTYRTLVRNAVLWAGGRLGER